MLGDWRSSAYLRYRHVDNVMITKNDIPVTRSHTTKVLGVIVDEQLSWANHIHVQWCRSRISSAVYAINAIKTFFLYHKHVCKPYITLSCILTNSMGFDACINYIRVVQRKAATIIDHSTNINGIKKLFRDLKLLNFDDNYKLALSRYMYCPVNMILPVSLIRHYGLNADIHGYNTRQNSRLHKAHSRTVLMANSFLSKGVDLWNSLPTNLCNCRFVASFNTSTKRYLLSSY